MLNFYSNISFTDGYADYTDYAIGLERAYEAFEDCVDRSLVNLNYSFESANESENKVTFIQRLKRLWDNVVGFFVRAIKKLKEIVKTAWNSLFKSNDNSMDKKVWVLYS